MIPAPRWRLAALPPWRIPRYELRAAPCHAPSGSLDLWHELPARGTRSPLKQAVLQGGWIVRPGVAGLGCECDGRSAARARAAGSRPICTDRRRRPRAAGSTTAALRSTICCGSRVARSSIADPDAREQLLHAGVDLDGGRVVLRRGATGFPDRRPGWSRRVRRCSRRRWLSGPDSSRNARQSSSARPWHLGERGGLSAAGDCRPDRLDRTPEGLTRHCTTRGFA
jgi:hypothetical protein